MRWRVTVIALTVWLAVMVWASPASAETIRDMQWYLSAVNTTQAQKVTRGDGVIVAVVDSGVDAGHPDLAGAVLPGASFLGSGSRAGQTDPGGHGTKMAGIIAARGGGPNHALGIAPGARILPVAVPTDGDAGSLAEPVRWAVDHGAKVINLSLGRRTSVPLPAGEANAIAYAMTKDVVVVASAGNRAEMPTGNALAMLPGVVAVSGLSRAGSFWSGSVQGDYVAIAAPSEDIVNIGARNIHNTGYSTGSGTSDGTAVVSGVIALIRAKFPNLDAANVINRLVSSAVDKGSPRRDAMYGFGALDALRAVTMDVPATTANPLGGASETGADATGAPGAAGTGDAGALPGRSGPSVRGLAILAGVLLAALVGAVLLIVVIWLVVRSRRRRRSPTPPVSVGPATGYSPYRPYPPGQPPPEFRSPDRERNY